MKPRFYTTIQAKYLTANQKGGFVRAHRTPSGSAPEKEYHLLLIPQVSKKLVLLRHCVTIHLMDVSGLESCVDLINIQLAVALLSCHALMNVITGLKWSSYFVKILRSIQRRSVQDASTSVLTARRLGSIEK